MRGTRGFRGGQRHMALTRLLFKTIAWLSLSLCVGSCLGRPTADEARAEFQSFVETVNQCQVVTDCVVVAPGCPLACTVAVRLDQKKATEQKARELIGEYERGGRSCAYDCAPAGPLACLAGRCAFGPEPTN